MQPPVQARRPAAAQQPPGTPHPACLGPQVCLERRWSPGGTAPTAPPPTVGSGWHCPKSLTQGLVLSLVLPTAQEEALSPSSLVHLNSERSHDFPGDITASEHAQSLIQARCLPAHWPHGCSWLLPPKPQRPRQSPGARRPGGAGPAGCALAASQGHVLPPRAESEQRLHLWETRARCTESESIYSGENIFVLRVKGSPFQQLNALFAGPGAGVAARGLLFQAELHIMRLLRAAPRPAKARTAVYPLI